MHELTVIAFDDPQAAAPVLRRHGRLFRFPLNTEGACAVRFEGGTQVELEINAWGAAYTPTRGYWEALAELALEAASGDPCDLDASQEFIHVIRRVRDGGSALLIVGRSAYLEASALALQGHGGVVASVPLPGAVASELLNAACLEHSTGSWEGAPVVRPTSAALRPSA